MEVLEHSEEIENVKPIESTVPSWTRSTLVHDHDPVDRSNSTCLLRSRTVFGVRSEGQVTDFLMSASHGELLGIDGEAIEFEWNIFPGCTSLHIHHLQKRNIEPEKFTDRIIFMAVFNDLAWTRRGNDEICISNSEKSRHTRRILAGTLDVLRSWRSKEVVWKIKLLP